MGSSEITRKFREKLIEVIEELYLFYKQSNNNNLALFQAKAKENNLNAKKNSIVNYVREMNKLCAQNSFMKRIEFEKLHKLNYNSSIEMFVSSKIEKDDSFEHFKKLLEDELKALYLAYKTRNENNAKIAENAVEGEIIKAFNLSKEIYLENMENKYVKKQLMKDEELEILHKEIKVISIKEVYILK